MWGCSTGWCPQIGIEMLSLEGFISTFSVLVIGPLLALTNKEICFYSNTAEGGGKILMTNEDRHLVTLG